MISDLNMSNEKMSDFVSFLLLWFTLVVKLRNLDFKSHSNTLIFCWCLFLIKNDVNSDLNVPWKNVSFCLRKT